MPAADESILPTVSLPPVRFHVIGDAYVDLFCWLHDGSLPQLGGDAILAQPVELFAGGSTVNTATHLGMMLRRRQSWGCCQQQPRNIAHIVRCETNTSTNTSNLNSNTYYSNATSSHIDDTNDNAGVVVVVHTMLNSHDAYGQLLLRHAAAHGFSIVNCWPRRSRKNNNCSSSNTDNNPEREETISPTNTNVIITDSSQNDNNTNTKSTPHCVVMVASNHSERSFMSHRGCATDFTAHDVHWPGIYDDDNNNNWDDDTTANNTNLHVHVAGFYCTPGFGRTSNHPTSSSLATELARLWARRRRRPPLTNSNSPNHTYHPPRTVVSLVTQFDVTQEWDGGLLDEIVPLLTILIMNELEANRIWGAAAGKATPTPTTTSSSSTNSNDDGRMMEYFSSFNRQTIFVVTKGSNGAMAFRDGQRIGQVGPWHEAIVPVLDPTGAGDAFTAGFIHGLWYYPGDGTVPPPDNGISPNDSYFSDNAVNHALLWGCTVGAAAVTKRGASVPSSEEFISSVHKKLKTSLGKVE